MEAIIEYLKKKVYLKLFANCIIPIIWEGNKKMLFIRGIAEVEIPRKWIIWYIYPLPWKTLNDELENR